MNARQLHKLFNPKSIAVIGASDAPGKVGYSLLRNLTINSFTGDVFPVNYCRDYVQGIKSYPRIENIPQEVDLAIIATRAETVPGIVNECVAKGVRSAVVISAGFSEAGEQGRILADQIKQTAESSEMALLGPNCLGFIRPKLKLNASFSRKMPPQGGIAFISQSGALCAAVLDWSVKENVGFSYFVSIGEMIDIGFHDLIDYFGNDPETKAILIYMETLSQARRFMSAARGFARLKPIIILKVGRSQEGAEAALYHTGSLTGNNQVFDAAFKRAGVLRVGSITELFDCGKTLSMQRLPKGNRLAIITNAGGPGVIATDALIDLNGELAILSPKTIAYLDQHLPENWSRGNPLDLLGDADPARHRVALEACLKDQNIDGILTILTPQAMTDAVSVANDLVKTARGSYKTLLASFMGEDDVAESRQILDRGKIPSYEKPEDAVRSFMNMHAYRQNLKLLTETPATIPHAFSPDTESNKKVLGDILQAGRLILTYPETRKILTNYEIPVPKGRLAHSPQEARKAAAGIGFPIRMRIVSPDIVYESEVGGIVTEIFKEEEIDAAYQQIINNVRRNAPESAIHGIFLENEVRKSYELLIGSKKDPIFGPVIAFGMGGVAVDIFRDTTIGIPPLNMSLAQQLIDGTKIAQLLKGHRGAPGADISAIQFMLYKFSYLIMDFPEISEIDINPFAVDEHGGVVLDAKIVLDKALVGKDIKPYSHLVICPYPKEYETTRTLKNGKSVLFRPIRPEDEPMEAELFQTFSEKTKRFRFFSPFKEATHEMLMRYTQIDYDREIALIAETIEDGRRKMIGVVRLSADAFNETAEYSIVVGDPWSGQGLGTALTQCILNIARDRGVKKVYAYTLPDNVTMLRILERYKFNKRWENELYYLELILDQR